MSRLTRDGTAEPVSRDQILRHARGQGNIIFPVQLTTSRIGNLTRLIHTLLYVMTIHTYCRESDGTGSVVLRVVPVTGAAFSGITMDQSMCASFTSTHKLCLIFSVTHVHYIPVVGVNVILSVRCNSGFLPDIILLTRCYYDVPLGTVTQSNYIP